jgi:thiamine kinase-like enzyme
MQALYDPRLTKGHRGFGPFANEKDFHRYVRAGFEKDSVMLHDPESIMTKEEQDEVTKMIEIQGADNRKICFTHGDAHAGNIMVRGKKVVGLIDFELSGFYPEYWEYGKVTYT